MSASVPAQARLLDGYEPVGLVKLDRRRAGVLSAKASVRAAWARQRGTQSPPTRAPGRAWRRPREKRRCRWPSVAAAHGWASERRGRYQSFLTRLELPRERSGLSPRRLGHRLHLERLLDKSDCLCLASGLGLCVCLACQSLRLVRWSGFVRLERFRQVGGLDRFRQVGAVSSGWRVGAVSSGWSGFVRLERFGQVSASRSNSTSLSVARSREIELLAEFTALLGCLVRRVHERAPQLISKLEQQPRSSRDRRTLERLLVRPRALDALLKIVIELQIEIELEIAVVEGMAHSFVCEDLLHAPCE